MYSHKKVSVGLRQTIMEKQIAIIILAAGSSSRLGRAKQLLELNGKTLLQKAVDTALKVSDAVVVVLGARKESIQPTIENFPIKITINENWAEGMSTSIQTGMTMLDENKYSSVLIMLSDQPHVDDTVLEKLIENFLSKKPIIVASEYDGKLGVPAIFDVSLFKELKNLKGQKGAKALIMKYQDKTEKVIFEKGKIDIDTEEDWENFKKAK